MPVGMIVALSEMVPVKPPMLVRVIVVVVEVSGLRVSVVGFAEIVKSGLRTVTVAGLDDCFTPLASVALKVTVYAPAAE